MVLWHHFLIDYMWRKRKEKPLENILVLRLSSIGDIVLTTPVLRCIKRQFPLATLHFLVKKQFSDVVSFNPIIDKVHVFDGDLSKNIEELKKWNFDAVVDLHHNLRTLKIKNALAVKRTYSFPKLNVQKWMYTNFKWQTMPDKSIVERYFEAVAPLGVKNDGLGLEFYIPEDKRTTKEDVPMGHWLGYVACVIGGSYATKQFPAAKWIEFVAACDFPIVLLGGKEDREMAAQIAQSDPVKIYNAVGKFNLLESADLVAKSRVVVSNDTGLMHIAAAFHKPLVSLWGNTTPEMGMFPYYGGNNLKTRVSPYFQIVEHNDLSCRPCSKIGFEKCPRKHFKCMNELDAGRIAGLVADYWKNEKH